MANSDTPMGLRPIKHLDGSPYNGGGNPYFLATGETNNIFIGDPVELAGSANTASVTVPGYGTFPPGTLPTVKLATTGATHDLIGCAVSFSADPTALQNQYRLASTARVVFVEDDPFVIYEIQEDSDGGSIAATDVGRNCDIIDNGSGSTITGLSTWELDSGTAATGATLQVRILRLVNRDDNAIGTNAKWEVLINSHQNLLNMAGVS